MSHISLSCILFVKIDFSFDSESKCYEDQEKKGLHFFLGRKNVQNGEIKMAASVQKNKHIYE